ncbi:hypothetical protein QVH37_14485 [Enterobacter pseudoroggenkampii]|uniref:hypothetical protein n=1 Tax=Enterobacter TaxID=547 RepID=UPI001BE0F40E|nr:MULTISPECIES: hypothetical protein [Enterobacter]MBT1814147.1 hypothetical protein [Enterobacter roggenkampii]WJW93211.1 hypothetical protein QVH37_14485 [Enterobacter pseudoroggenkampii]
MKMSDITIDFNRLVKDSNKKLFAGRANGRQAYDYFHMNNFCASGNDRLYLSIPKGIVVSSSYFLGMLETILPKFTSPSEFYSKTVLDGHEYREGMLSELDRAVRRGLHKNVPFF